MTMLTALCMNGIVLWSSFLLTYRRIRLEHFVDSLGCWCIMCFSQIVLTELLLGIAGILTLQNVIALNCVLLACVWLYCKNSASSWNPSSAIAQLPILLQDKTILLAFSILIGFGIIKLGINLLNPPFGWDSLNYHFVFPVEWLKTGNLDVPMTVFDDPGPTYYPINGSLLYLWLMLPLRNVFLADLGQAPFFLLCLLAAYSIGRKIGLSVKYSLYAAVLFMLIPNFFKQLRVAYVDVMVAGLFLASLNFLLSAQRFFSLKHVLSYSLSLGLLLGTKIVALPYVMLLFFPFVMIAVKNYTKWRFFVISLFLIVLTGGFAYVRNFLETQNPLYPLNFVWCDKVIFKGVIDKITYGAHFQKSDFSLVKLLFSEGLGGQTTLFALPACILAVPVYVLKKRGRLSLFMVYFFALPFLLYCAFRFINPFPNTRYAYPLLGTAIINALYISHAYAVPHRIVIFLVNVCCIASMAELAKRNELIAGIILSFAMFFLLPHIFKKRSGGALRKKAVAPAVALVIFVSCVIFLNSDYVKNEYSRYIRMVKYSGFWKDATIAWDWLNENTHGNNIAYAGRPVAFPLYGSNFKNNVYYASVNAVDPPKLHYFKESRYQWDSDFLNMHKSWEHEGNYRSRADYRIWLKNLQKHTTDYLFVYSLHQVDTVTYPLEDTWAANHPELFRLVFVNPIVHIYEVKK